MQKEKNRSLRKKGANSTGTVDLRKTAYLNNGRIQNDQIKLNNLAQEYKGKSSDIKAQETVK